jgi:hypothetical protein
MKALFAYFFSREKVGPFCPFFEKKGGRYL